MTRNPMKEGELDRQRGIETNPYHVEHALPLYKRIFLPKSVKQQYQALARAQWDLGWINEDTRIANEKYKEDVKRAQDEFQVEIQKNHERFKFLLKKYLKRTNGYLDLQILGLAHVSIGNQHLDEQVFKDWIDQEMKNNNNG